MAETHSSKVQSVRQKAWEARGQDSRTSPKMPSSPSHFTLQAGFFFFLFFSFGLFLISSFQKVEEKINEGMVVVGEGCSALNA